MRMLPDGYNSGDTIYVYFDTYGANGESITMSGLAVTDIEIYKNGSTTQRASDNGYTLLDTDGIDFDGVTGLHGFSVDTSDNSDAGFWADGSHYVINVNSITINGQTVRFSYGLRLGILSRPITPGRKTLVASTGHVGIDWANVGNPSTTVNLGNTTVSISSSQEINIATLSGQSTWTELLNDNQVAGSFGQWVGQTLPARITGVVALASDLTTLPGLTADAVWDEDATAHQTQGTFGQAVGDPGATATSIWSRVTTALPNATSGATNGLVILGSNNARLSLLDGLTVFDADSHALVITSMGGDAIRLTGSDDDITLVNSDAPTLAAAIWAGTTRTLTALDEDTTTLDLDSTIRASVGLSAANLDAQLLAIDDFLDTEVAAIKAKTDNLPVNPAAVTDIPTVSQIWTTALTEAYRATGATGTAAQLLYEMIAHLGESSIAGAIKTLKKLDGATTAKTYTLNSATTPTSITETT